MTAQLEPINPKEQKAQVAARASSGARGIPYENPSEGILYHIPGQSPPGR